MDLPMKTGDLLRTLILVEAPGTKEPYHIWMLNYACAMALTQKRPFAALVIRTTPREQEEQLSYEMDCFGTRHTLTYPTVFIDQMNERDLLAKKNNPVALAAICTKRMLKAKKNEDKRYLCAKELLTTISGTEYSVETCIALMQFIEGMAGLNTPRLKRALKNDLEQGIMEKLREVNDMRTVRTPILRTALRNAAQEIFRAEGKAEEKLETARRMLSRGMGIDVISDVTELPEEEIRGLENGDSSHEPAHGPR
jgi:hypothetical protein